MKVGSTWFGIFSLPDHRGVYNFNVLTKNFHNQPTRNSEIFVSVKHEIFTETLNSNFCEIFVLIIKIESFHTTVNLRVFALLNSCII